MANFQKATARQASATLPLTRPVRHGFWKYPLLALAVLIVGLLLAAAIGSPNWPRDTIAGVSKQDPGGAILAFTQELDNTSSSTINEPERGMGKPADVFVLDPLREAAPLLGGDIQSALQTYDAADADQQQAWSSAYDDALATITPQGSGDMGAASPDYSRIDSLEGDFGPVPTLVQADLQLAQSGFLEQYLQGVEPGHEWGMVKERSLVPHYPGCRACEAAERRNGWRLRPGQPAHRPVPTVRNPVHTWSPRSPTPPAPLSAHLPTPDSR